MRVSDTHGIRGVWAWLRSAGEYGMYTRADLFFLLDRFVLFPRPPRTAPLRPLVLGRYIKRCEEPRNRLYVNLLSGGIVFTGEDTPRGNYLPEAYSSLPLLVLRVREKRESSKQSRQRRWNSGLSSNTPIHCSRMVSRIGSGLIGVTRRAGCPHAHSPPNFLIASFTIIR